MNASADTVLLTDVARLAEVSAAAVSNWRRRHGETFPRSGHRGGQESFLAAEIAEWLDRRKIAKNDLKDGELTGMTYGDRFRRGLGSPARLTPATEDALWQELDRQRGTVDAGVHADLVLGLLYLCVRYDDGWPDLVAAATGSMQRRSEIGQLLERAIEIHESFAPYIRRTLSAVLAESRDVELLAAIIRLLDRVRGSGELVDGRVLKDWAARTFEDLLARFAAAEGKRGGEFRTPPTLVRVLVELVSPMPGDTVHDPCCDSGGMLVGAAKIVAARAGSPAELSLSGQALQERSWRLARMNVELNGLVADLGPRPGLALQEDLHVGQQFDVVVMNPPFNMTRWSTSDPAPDPRWHYGLPPAHNANFAWLQHALSSLAEGGRAAVVMANGASSSENAQERAIRAAMVEDGVVEGLIALPPRLFSSTAVPVTIWLLKRSARGEGAEVLFIDATDLGSMVSRSQRILAPDDIDRVVGECMKWRVTGKAKVKGYAEVPGFSASVTIQEIRNRGYLLNPRAYVAMPVYTEIAVEKIFELRRDLDRLNARSVTVDATADRQLERIGKWIH